MWCFFCSVSPLCLLFFFCTCSVPSVTCHEVNQGAWWNAKIQGLTDPQWWISYALSLFPVLSLLSPLSAFYSVSWWDIILKTYLEMCVDKSRSKIKCDLSSQLPFGFLVFCSHWWGFFSFSDRTSHLAELTKQGPSRHLHKAIHRWDFFSVLWKTWEFQSVQKGWVVGYGFKKKRGPCFPVTFFHKMAKFNAASCVFLPYLHSKAKGGVYWNDLVLCLGSELLSLW